MQSSLYLQIEGPPVSRESLLYENLIFSRKGDKKMNIKCAPRPKIVNCRQKLINTAIVFTLSLLLDNYSHFQNMELWIFTSLYLWLIYKTNSNLYPYPDFQTEILIFIIKSFQIIKNIFIIKILKEFQIRLEFQIKLCHTIS